MLRLPALALLAGLSMAAGAGPVAAQAPAEPATVTGSVRGSVPPLSKGVIVVRAIDATSGAVADVSTIGKGRSFTLAIPPGAYAIRASVARPGKTSGDATIPVTVTAGQRRSGLRFQISARGKIGRASRASAARAIATAEATATRSYVAADGVETPGITAYAVEDFTGGSGTWKDVRKGLPAFVQTELSDTTVCATQGIASGRERRYLERSLRFPPGRFVTRGTKVQRNMIVADVAVGGTIKSRGNRATITLVLVDKKTGKTFDSVRATVTTAKFTADARKLARAIGERLCRIPKAYELTLAIAGSANFTSHTATGRVDGTLIARQSGGAGGQSPTWRGDSKVAWNSLAFKSKSTCTYGNIKVPDGSWGATLSVLNGQLTVDWAPSGELYLTAATATAYCPGLPAAANQAGPSLGGILPNATRLPLTGGVVPVSGTLVVGDQGITNTGTLTVKPLWTTTGA